MQKMLAVKIVMSWLLRNDSPLFPPSAGNWYVDKTGTLFKVKMLVHSEGKLEHIVIDYPRVGRRLITLRSWDNLIFRADPPAFKVQ